jgi:hypothetical protein
MLKVLFLYVHSFVLFLFLVAYIYFFYRSLRYFFLAWVPYIDLTSCVFYQIYYIISWYISYLLPIVLFKVFWLKNKCRIGWNYLLEYTTSAMHGSPWHLWQFEQCTLVLRAEFLRSRNLKRQMLIPKINMHTWWKLTLNIVSSIQPCFMTCIKRKNQIRVVLCFFSFLTNKRRRKE